MSERITVVPAAVVLAPYQAKINAAIAEYIPLLGPKSRLRDACEYALLAGGKRLRPAIVLMMANALEKHAEATFAALSVEFFHTASLVADDMPSMDDDEQRRGAPSVHKQFGEAEALLASYALIAAGYECIAKNAEVVARSSLSFSDRGDRIGILALQNAVYNTGLQGATGGQFLDIAPPDLSLSRLWEIIHKKTSSLFEIAFVFGWLFGGGDPELLPGVKQMSAHFGRAFQIADDLGDMEQDRKNKRLVNVANVCGEKDARQMFHEEHRRFLLALNGLGVRSEELEALASLLLP